MEHLIKFTPEEFKEAREKLLNLQIDPEFYREYVKREMEFILKNKDELI